MLAALGIFAVVSVLELRSIVKHKDKKQAALYAAVAAAAVALGIFLLLASEYKSFAKIMTDLFRSAGGQR